jgi:hypothetical protein
MAATRNGASTPQLQRLRSRRSDYVRKYPESVWCSHGRLQIDTRSSPHAGVA